MAQISMLAALCLVSSSDDAKPVDSLEARVKALAVELHDRSNASTRLRAAAALGDLGQRARWARPALIAALRDEHTMVRFYAADALGKLGPVSDGGWTTSKLRRVALSEPEWIVARKALLVLVELDAREFVNQIEIRVQFGRSSRPPRPPRLPELSRKSLSEWVSLLKDDDGQVRRTAMRAVAQNLNRKTSARHLVPLATDPDPRIREDALQVLWGIGSEADLAAALAYAITHRLGTQHTVELIQQMKRGDRFAEALLPALYGYGNPRIRVETVRAIVRLKRQDRQSLLFVQGALADPNAAVRLATRAAIERFALNHRPLRDRLLARAKQRRDSTLVDSLTTLRSAGLRKKTAAPLLERFLKNEPDASLRVMIVSSLGNSQPTWDSAVPVLVSTIQGDPSSVVRLQAIRSLGRIGSQARVADPTLFDILATDKNSTIRFAAIEALGKIDPGNPQRKKLLANVRAELTKVRAQIEIQDLRQTLETIIAQQNRIREETEETRKRIILRQLSDLDLE